jgi:hypothetical protein
VPDMYAPRDGSDWDPTAGFPAGPPAWGPPGTPAPPAWAPPGAPPAAWRPPARNRTAGGTFTQRNSTSLLVLAVVAAYLALAASTHIVLFGIFPLMLSIQAFKRREPLAFLALIAAGIAILTAVTAL